jgi:hypothetical protein
LAILQIFSSAYLQSLMIISGKFWSDGRQDMCDRCPDITVHEVNRLELPPWGNENHGVFLQLSQMIRDKGFALISAKLMTGLCKTVLEWEIRDDAGDSRGILSGLFVIIGVVAAVHGASGLKYRAWRPGTLRSNGGERNIFQYDVQWHRTQAYQEEPVIAYWYAHAEEDGKGNSPFFRENFLTVSSAILPGTIPRSCGWGCAFAGN